MPLPAVSRHRTASAPRHRHPSGYLAGVRFALAALALVIAADGAQAQSAANVAACRDVKDSLLRLRCFDDVSKPAARAEPSAPTVAAKPKAPNFAAYAAVPYRGPIGLPISEAVIASTPRIELAYWPVPRPVRTSRATSPLCQSAAEQDVCSCPWSMCRREGCSTLLWEARTSSRST